MTELQIIVACVAWITAVTIDGILLYRLLFVYNKWYEFYHYMTIGRKIRRREKAIRNSVIKPLFEDQIHYG